MNDILGWVKSIGFEPAVAAASLIVSIAAVWIARSSLLRAEDSIQQAAKVADRDLKDWRQTKWFDLYLKANEAYDKLDAFQAQYANELQIMQKTEGWKQDFNELMKSIRVAHAMATVFPVNPIITEFCLSTAAFENPEEALSKKRLERIFDSLIELKKKAHLDSTILG